MSHVHENGLKMALLAGALAMAGTAQGKAAAEGQSLQESVPAQQPLYSPANDPTFAQPFIDVDEWRDGPVRHRYVHGGFKGTDTKFVFYFPSKEQYGGRFFHYISPVPVPEDQILNGFGNDGPFKGTGVAGLALASGGYAVGSNQGGRGATATPGGKVDPSIAAYRASAAVAEYSRVLAQQMYGPHRTYGYAYGGSGGSMRTLAGAENTAAWDGVVPYVMGTPQAIPSPFTARAHAIRVLREKLPQIADAVQPGGSDAVFKGLNEEERAAWNEIAAMGFPVSAWSYWGSPFLGLGSFEFTFGQMRRNDPTYFKEFWTVPGYLGADPPPSLRADRIQQTAHVARVIMSDQAASAGVPPPPFAPGADAANAWRFLQQRRGGAAFPVAVELTGPPAHGDLRLADMIVKSGAAAGSRFPIAGINGKFAMLATPPPGEDHADPFSLKRGDEVLIDNSDFLAAQTYHRHQVPSRDYYVWDQFRGADGTPLYPQRARLMGEGFYQSAAGKLPTGKFHGKMIVVQALQDFDAFPWMADWYRQKVQANLGPATDSRYRLWYVDNATHGTGYQPVLEQALHDLAAWVEKDAPPPAATAYRIENGQVIVPPGAHQRKGVQPVVTVRAKGGERADISFGQTVSFSATIEVPPGAGSIVAAEWDFDGDGEVDSTSPVPAGAKRATVSATHRYDKTCTFFPTLRAFSQRQGDTTIPYARIENQGRLRVVVSPAVSSHHDGQR